MDNQGFIIIIRHDVQYQNMPYICNLYAGYLYNIQLNSIVYTDYLVIFFNFSIVFFR